MTKKLPNITPWTIGSESITFDVDHSTGDSIELEFTIDQSNPQEACRFLLFKFGDNKTYLSSGSSINRTFTFNSDGVTEVKVIGQPSFAGVTEIRYEEGPFVLDSLDHTLFPDLESVFVDHKGTPTGETTTAFSPPSLRRVDTRLISGNQFGTSYGRIRLSRLADTVEDVIVVEDWSTADSYADLPANTKIAYLGEVQPLADPAPPASEFPQGIQEFESKHDRYGSHRDATYLFWAVGNNITRIFFDNTNFAGNSADASISISSQLKGPVWNGNVIPYNIASVRAHLLSQPNLESYETQRTPNPSSNAHGDLKTPIGGTALVDPNDPSTEIDYSDEPNIFNRTAGEPLINSTIQRLVLDGARLGWPPVDFSQATSLNYFSLEKYTDTDSSDRSSVGLWPSGVLNECVEGLWGARTTLNSNGDGTAYISVSEWERTSLSQDAKYRLVGVGPYYNDGLTDAGHTVKHDAVKQTSSYDIVDSTTIILPWTDTATVADGSVFRILSGPNEGQYEIETLDESTGEATIVSNTTNFTDSSWDALQTSFTDPNDESHDVVGVDNRAPYSKGFNAERTHRNPDNYLPRSPL